MSPGVAKANVYLEVGSRRTFAGSIEWPGWCRSGPDESAALDALFAYGPRYERALRSARLGFHAPAQASALRVVERLPGDATTDFGAPGARPSADAAPVDPAELRRLLAIVKAVWRAFDAAVDAAQGKELRKGPRGGGRELSKILLHVIEADAAYLSRIGVSFKVNPAIDPVEELRRIRAGVLTAIPTATEGLLPSKGPRGGVRWSPRTFVRRLVWHVLDHAWEIEDRLV